jgi:glyoxylase-like metal-dependent hydrolase (beta-lactamase superfamily II)
MHPTEPEVYFELHHASGTCQYLVVDPSTRQAVIIDSFLDFDIIAQRVGTASPDKLLRLVKKHNATFTKLLETHTHGDHLMAVRYIQHALHSSSQPKPEICTGSRVKITQSTVASKYGISWRNEKDTCLGKPSLLHHALQLNVKGGRLP